MKRTVNGLIETGEQTVESSSGTVVEGVEHVDGIFIGAGRGA